MSIISISMTTVNGEFISLVFNELLIRIFQQ